MITIVNYALYATCYFLTTAWRGERLGLSLRLVSSWKVTILNIYLTWLILMKVGCIRVHCPGIICKIVDPTMFVVQSTTNKDIPVYVAKNRFGESGLAHHGNFSQNVLTSSIGRKNFNILDLVATNNQGNIAWQLEINAIWITWVAMTSHIFANVECDSIMLKQISNYCHFNSNLEIFQNQDQFQARTKQTRAGMLSSCLRSNLNFYLAKQQQDWTSRLSLELCISTQQRKLIPGATVVVVVVVVVVVDDAVVVVWSSTSHLLSPLMHVSQVSSRLEQSLNSWQMGSWDLKERNVNQAQANVFLHSSKHSSLVWVDKNWTSVPRHSPSIQQMGSSEEQSLCPLMQSGQRLASTIEWK